MRLLEWLFGRPKQFDPPVNVDTGHHYCCECSACIDAAMRSEYEDRGIKRPTAEQLAANQREYDRLVAKLGGAPSKHTSDAYEMHKQIMRIMRGNEAEPT